MKNFKPRWIVIPTCLMLAASIVSFADDKPQKDSSTKNAAELLKKLATNDPSTATFGWQGKKNRKFQSRDWFFSPQSAGKYWIGVQCSPVSDDLRSQLGLKKGIGLVVQSISPASPASKSKLQKHDVLLKIGDRNLNSVGNLTKAIQKTEGEKIQFVVIRKGKKQSVTVTPAERKSYGGQFQFSPFDENDAQKQFQKFFKDGRFKLKFDKMPKDGIFELKFDDKKMEDFMKRFKSKDFKKGFDMKFFGPGVIMPFDKDGNFKSSNSSIMIMKTNDGKAKIRVRKSGKTWETTEDKLDKLPKDIRKEVEQALKNTKSEKGSGFRFQFGGKDFPNTQIKGFNFPGFSSSNFTIMMTRTDDGKTKIKVMKDGKSWEVDEDELDKLPKEIRGKVKAALKNKVEFPNGRFGGNFFQRQKRSGSKDDDFQKKVDELNRQVEELQKALENLKKKKRRKSVSQDIV